jgi:FixJ family two-component response regulator
MGQLSKVPVISIIDDDESVRVAISSLVRSLGLSACGFASAEDFLRSPDLQETACLITDVQMPGMTGIELQEVLIAQGRRMPIIFITAFPEEKIRQRLLAAGAAAFLIKPFDGQTMIKCLDTVLGEGGEASAP